MRWRVSRAGHDLPDHGQRSRRAKTLTLEQAVRVLVALGQIAAVVILLARSCG
jgi:hypothetical protein